MSTVEMLSIHDRVEAVLGASQPYPLVLGNNSIDRLRSIVDRVEGSIL